jgi:4-alpha-glucanotransferase
MKFTRSSGILLHPSSFPGPYGIGEIGPYAKTWIDFLAESGTKLWQILPLGPTGYGDSPYQCFSTFAGNPYLISLDQLLNQKLLHKDDLSNIPDFPKNQVQYGDVIYWKLDILNKSFDQFRFTSGESHHLKAQKFYEKEQEWLDDFALFMALKEFHGGEPWTDWPTPYRDRYPEALNAFQDNNSYAVERQKYYQYLFFDQWSILKEYANSQGIKIIGDIPIFIAHDSADGVLKCPVPRGHGLGH